MPLNTVFWDEQLGYPVGILDESISIYFQHYKSIEEAKEKWETRRKRVNFDNIKLIATDRDGMDEELLKRLLDLPYPKVVYVNKPEKVLQDSCIYVPGFENEESVPDMTAWVGLHGQRRFDYYFDIFDWVKRS